MPGVLRSRWAAAAPPRRDRLLVGSGEATHALHLVAGAHVGVHLGARERQRVRPCAGDHSDRGQGAIDKGTRCGGQLTLRVGGGWSVGNVGGNRVEMVEGVESVTVSEVKVLRESRESSVSNVKMCEVVKRV